MLDLSTLEPQLHALLTRRGEDGKSVYQPEHVTHLLPFLLFAGAGGVEAETIPEPVADHVGRLYVALGLKPDAPPRDIALAAADYYRRYPVHPSLMQEVTRLLSDGKQTDWSTGARAMVRVMARVDAKQWLPAADAKGRVHAGPLARAALNVDASKKKPRKKT